MTPDGAYAQITLEGFERLQAELNAQLNDGQLIKDAAKRGAAWLGAVHRRRVAPSDAEIAALQQWLSPLPRTRGEAPDANTILSELDRLGSPVAMAQTGGRFHGLVNGGVLPVSLAARILSDCWDQNAVLHAVSPVSSCIEGHVETWLKELFGLPQDTVAGFVSGSSMAIVCGLAAARHALLEKQGWDINRRGLDGAPRLRIVTSEHTHSTVLKAVSLLGFGTDRIEFVPVDKQGRLSIQALPALDELCIVIVQAGNVNSGAFDPIAEIVRQAREVDAWVHVDGAFGLWAAASGSLRHLCAGIDDADSFSVDAHKTLNAPYDSGIVLCRHESALVNALQNNAAYIMNSAQRDSILYVPEMSRRARATDLWAALAWLGREGVDLLVTGLHLRACEMAAELQINEFEVINDVVFNQVLIRIGDEQQTAAFAAAVQASGESWVGTSNWFDEPVVRISLCSWATTRDDIRRSVVAFSTARKQVLQS